MEADGHFLLEKEFAAYVFCWKLHSKGFNSSVSSCLFNRPDFHLVGFFKNPLSIIPFHYLGRIPHWSLHGSFPGNFTFGFRSCRPSPAFILLNTQAILNFEIEENLKGRMWALFIRYFTLLTQTRCPLFWVYNFTSNDSIMHEKCFYRQGLDDRKEYFWCHCLLPFQFKWRLFAVYIKPIKAIFTFPAAKHHFRNQLSLAIVSLSVSGLMPLLRPLAPTALGSSSICSQGWIRRVPGVGKKHV